MERSHMRSSQTRPIAGLGWLTLLTTLTMAACGGQVTVQGSAPASVAAASGASVASPASAKPAASAVAQPFSSPAAAAPAASQVSLKFVFSPPTAYSAAIFAAFDEGFFKKYGLDVALTPSNSATVVQSVVSGEVPLAFGTATNGTNAIAEGAPFKLVASDGNFSGIVVVSRPEVQSWSDLRGKTMAVSDPFSSSDVVTRLLLAKNGLVYNKDVKILAMGSLSAQAAALESGQVAAAGLTPDIAVKLQSRGHRLLANMAAIRIPLSDGGIYANNSYARAHPEVVRGAIRSVWEGTRTVLTNYDVYTRVVRAHVKDLDDAQVKANYDVMSVLWGDPANPRITPEAIAPIMDILSEPNPKVKSLKFADIVDDSYVKQLNREGVFGGNGCQGC